MQLSLKQLSMHLKQPLSPLYLISGDEPLLMQEVRDAIFLAAKSQAFSDKTIFHISAGFQAETIIESIQNQSLFSTKKIIDIRNPSAKMDADLTAFFQTYLAHPTDDRVIVISTDKLSAATQKSAWFELFKKHGIYIPVWPIRSSEMPAWIIERAAQFQLTMSMSVAQMLAHFSEGNLLSTHQAIQKLALLYPAADITREQLITVLFDHARFTIFDLSESMRSNNLKKIMRILARLEQTGEEPTLVLWAICRQLRENSASDKTKKALQKAAHVDEIIKGARTGNVWQALLELCL